MEHDLNSISISASKIEQERLRIELCLLDFLGKALNKEDMKQLKDEFTNNTISKVLFMISNQDFSEVLTKECDEEMMIATLIQFLNKQGIPSTTICDLVKLKERDPNEVVTFACDVIGIVKVFNHRHYKYLVSLMNKDLAIYLEDIIKPTVEWLQDHLAKIDGMDVNGDIDNQIRMQEQSLKKISDMQEKLDKVMIHNKDLEIQNEKLLTESKEFQYYLDDANQKVKNMEQTLVEKDRENLQLIDTFEDMAEELTAVRINEKKMKDACEKYLIAETNMKQVLGSRNHKIANLQAEINDNDKSITVMSLQLKEFARLGEQYKNEKDSFQKRREIVNELQKSNDDSDQKLYYYHHKNHQLEVEKQKLDQYIKLCQYQIQKLTSEEKRLKHENHVYKTMNINLMELGYLEKEENTDPSNEEEEAAKEIIPIAAPTPLGKPKRTKDSTKMINMLKENMKVVINKIKKMSLY